MPAERCKHCARSNTSSRAVLRMDGWRFFEGKSVTGRPLVDVACPECAGTNEDYWDDMTLSIAYAAGIGAGRVEK